MRSVHLKRFNCCIKSTISSSKINLFSKPGELGLFLKEVGGVEPITQVGYLSNISKFGFQEFHKEEVIAHIQRGLSDKSLMRHLTPRQCLKLLNLFATLDKAELHPQIETLTEYIIDSMAQFTQEELKDLTSVYEVLHDKNLFFLEKSLSKNFHSSMNLKPYLQSIGVDNLIEKEVLISCDLNRRIMIKDIRDQFTLDVIFYDDSDINGINVVKTRLFKDKTKFLNYFVDNQPFDHNGIAYGYINNDTAVHYGELLQEKGYRFDDKETLMMYRPGGKRPCAVNTFIAFLNLKNDLSVQLVGSKTADSFNRLAQISTKKELASKIGTMKRLTQISIASYIARNTTCTEMTLTNRQARSQCYDAVKSIDNPMRYLIQTDLYQNLYQAKIDSTCRQMVDSMRQMINNSSGSTHKLPKESEPRFCAFINSKYKSLFLYHIVNNLANRKADSKQADSAQKHSGENLSDLSQDYVTLDELIAGDSLITSEASSQWLNLQELFQVTKKNAGYKCSLAKLLL